MRRLCATAVVAMVIGISSPVGAAETVISATGNAPATPYEFDPQKARIVQGTTVTWRNDSGAAPHTATQDGGLWDTETIPANGDDTASVVVKWAGTFFYYCEFHGAPKSGMFGSVRVPVKAAPTSGAIGDTFVIRVATAPAPDGFVYDIQRKFGDGAWTKFKTGITRASVKFEPTKNGAYAFRSRVRSEESNAEPVSAYSPRAVISVSPAPAS